jgi:hypothetical protein
VGSLTHLEQQAILSTTQKIAHEFFEGLGDDEQPVFIKGFKTYIYITVRF